MGLRTIFTTRYEDCPFFVVLVTCRVIELPNCIGGVFYRARWVVDVAEDVIGRMVTR